MQCPICTALNRERNHECEAEATATLKRRSVYADISARQQLDEDVLRSRKRQAHIVFELRQHRIHDHLFPGISRLAFC